MMIMEYFFNLYNLQERLNERLEINGSSKYYMVNQLIATITTMRPKPFIIPIDALNHVFLVTVRMLKKKPKMSPRPYYY